MMQEVKAVFRRFSKGFTLIELLVVVLIVGILAALAIPQYQFVVEKNRAAEALILLRAIADANYRYYLATGTYAGHNNLDKLDIDIPKAFANNVSSKRIATANFIYSPGSSEHENYLAQANRSKEGSVLTEYYIYMRAEEYPNKFRCWAYSQSSSISKKICSQINTTGKL